MNSKKRLPADTPLYNSRIIDTYIKLLKRKNPFVDIDEILDYAGMKAYEIADQGHWFSQEQIDRFHSILSRKPETKISPEKPVNTQLHPKLWG